MIWQQSREIQRFRYTETQVKLVGRVRIHIEERLDSMWNVKQDEILVNKIKQETGWKKQMRHKIILQA